ncbi:MAG: TFIIB-type zinc ribbon-containing protein [Nitrososphaeraceae archaeon]
MCTCWLERFSISSLRPFSISSKPHYQILCSICNRSDKIVTDPESGEIICSSCGMVISDKVEDASHSERRIFSGGGQIGDTRARTGAPTSLARHDMGLATIIGGSDRDSSGQKIDPYIYSTMQIKEMGF